MTNAQKAAAQVTEHLKVCYDCEVHHTFTQWLEVLFESFYTTGRIDSQNRMAGDA